MTRWTTNGRGVTLDREEVSRLVGLKVAVRLDSVEARGLEIIATLDEARDDGIVLSEIGELGPVATCQRLGSWRSR